MHNRDLNSNTPTSSLPESSPNSGSTGPATAPALTPEVEESKLERQVDAAMREVEDLLVRTPPTRAAGIDWSIPQLVQPVDKIAESKTFDEPAAETLVGSPEEAEVRNSLRVIEKKILEIGDARQQAESRLLIKLEGEATLQVEAWARRREEEELRQRAEEEAVRRREEDHRKLEAHRKQVIRSENELRGCWLEERRLRSEVVRLNQTAHDLFQRRLRAEEDAKLALLAEAQRARDETDKVHEESLGRLHNEEEALRRAISRFSSRRTELEIERQRHEAEARKLEEERTRLSSATTARLVETARIRRDAEEQLRLEQEQLALRENELARLTESLSERRVELDLARQRAQEDAQRLAEARERMRLAEESSQRAEHERLTLEAEIFERAESQRRMLEDARARAEDQQRQLEADARERQEREAQRLAELEALRSVAEGHAQVQTEMEQGLAGELQALELAVDTTKKRIAELQQQHTTSSETHARMLERLKRVEQEAEARATEETEARADLERRVKEKIEQLRVLEIEQQQRVDEEIARRSEAEKRLAELRDRYQAEQAARIKAELQFDMWTDPAPEKTADSTGNEIASTLEVTNEKGIPVYQVGNLSSADPRLRADALSALARLGSHDAFELIANCFDDESSLVRNSAARAILTLEPHRPVELLTQALKNASPERSARIGRAISESGLAAQAINDLSNKDAEGSYNSLCVLFAMAKTGEVAPLIDAIENHNDAEVRLAAVRLLKLSGQEDLASAAVNRRLQTNPMSDEL